MILIRSTRHPVRLPCRPEEIDGHPDDKRRQLTLRLCRT